MYLDLSLMRTFRRGCGPRVKFGQDSKNILVEHRKIVMTDPKTPQKKVMKIRKNQQKLNKLEQKRNGGIYFDYSIIKKEIIARSLLNYNIVRKVGNHTHIQ